MNSKRLFRSSAMRLVFSLCGMLLAGCQHLPSSLPFVQNSAADAAMLTNDPPPPEAREWPDVHYDVLNQRARGYGLVRLPEMQRYLNDLLTRIKQQAGVPTWPGAVYILASPALDAYATASGNIYVSQSWLTSISTEDEIVALLSHEFAHVYLHYHQLEGAIQATDQAAGLVALGTGLAFNVSAQTGWTEVDTLLTGYMATRELLSTTWARSQESAADLFGLNMTLKLGYSYGAGFKALLERLATWEEENEKRQEIIEEALLKEVKARAAAAVQARNEHPDQDFSNAMFKPLAVLVSGISGGLHQGATDMDKLVSKAVSRHPDTIARLDRLSMAIEHLPLEELNEVAVTKPWVTAQRQRRTAQTLKNYQLAIQALQNLDDRQALTLAQQSSKGVTATHALPLHALYRAQLARAAATGKTTRIDNASAVLNRNISARPDRAWISYLERSNALLEAGQRSAAQKVISSGFTYFNDAPEVWPPTIAFIGSSRSWDEAKRMAAQCKERFPAHADACNKAATTPAERSEEERVSKQKAEQLVNRLLKR